LECREITQIALGSLCSRVFREACGHVAEIGAFFEASPERDRRAVRFERVRGGSVFRHADQYMRRPYLLFQTIVGFVGQFFDQLLIHQMVFSQLIAVGSNFFAVIQRGIFSFRSGLKYLDFQVGVKGKVFFRGQCFGRIGCELVFIVRILVIIDGKLLFPDFEKRLRFGYRLLWWGRGFTRADK
jgi:hypothetical protein